MYIAIYFTNHYLCMLNLSIIFSHYIHVDQEYNTEITATVSKSDIFLSLNQCHNISCARFITSNDNNKKLSGVTCVVHDLMVSNIIKELNNASIYVRSSNCICMYIYDTYVYS